MTSKSKTIRVTDNIGANGNVSVDLESPESYVRHIAVEKAKAANRVAVILIVSLVLSLPCYLIALWVGVPESSVDKVFDRWFNAMTPLFSGIVGTLFGMSLAKKD